jgi:hypothetical protein
MNVACHKDFADIDTHTSTLSVNYVTADATYNALLTPQHTDNTITAV